MNIRKKQKLLNLIKQYKISNGRRLNQNEDNILQIIKDFVNEKLNINIKNFNIDKKQTLLYNDKIKLTFNDNLVGKKHSIERWVVVKKQNDKLMIIIRYYSNLLYNSDQEVIYTYVNGNWKQRILHPDMKSPLSK